MLNNNWIVGIGCMVIGTIIISLYRALSRPFIDVENSCGYFKKNIPESIQKEINFKVKNLIDLSQRQNTRKSILELLLIILSLGVLIYKPFPIPIFNKIFSLYILYLFLSDIIKGFNWAINSAFMVFRAYFVLFSLIVTYNFVAPSEVDKILSLVFAIPACYIYIQKTFDMREQFRRLRLFDKDDFRNIFIQQVLHNIAVKLHYEKNKDRYSWGNCRKCGHPLVNKYGLFCPDCKTPFKLNLFMGCPCGHLVKIKEDVKTEDTENEKGLLKW